MLNDMAVNDVLYLSFLPLCDPSYVVGIPDGGGILTKLFKTAGSTVQFHYIGRAGGGAYPYIIDKYGVPTGDTLNMNNTLSTIYSHQMTALLLSLGYTATLANDDHIVTNATARHEFQLIKLTPQIFGLITGETPVQYRGTLTWNGGDQEMPLLCLEHGGEDLVQLIYASTGGVTTLYKVVGSGYEQDTTISDNDFESEVMPAFESLGFDGFSLAYESKLYSQLSIHDVCYYIE